MCIELLWVHTIPPRVLAILMPEWSYQSILKYSKNETTPPQHFISLLKYRLREHGFKWGDIIDPNWVPRSVTW